MTEPPFVKRERTLLREMLRLIEHRAKTEHCTEVYEERVQDTRTEAEQSRKAIEKRFQSEQGSAKTEYEEARGEVSSRFEGEHKTIQKEFSESRYVTTTEFDNSLQIARTEHSEGRWTITTLADAARTKAETRAQEIQAKITGQLEKAAALREEALKELRPWLVPMPGEPPAVAGKYDGESDPAQVLTKLFATAESGLARAKKSLLIQILKENRFFYILGVVAVLAAVAGFFIGGPIAMVIAIIGAGAGGAGLYFWLQQLARKQAIAAYVPFNQTLAELVAFCGRYSEVLKASHAKQLAKLKQKFEEELAEADEKHKRRVTEMETARDKSLRSSKERYTKKIMQMEEGRDRALSEAEEKFNKIQKASQERYDRDLRENMEREKKELADAKTWHETTWADLIRDWHNGLAHAQSEAAAINAEATRLYPSWDDAAVGSPGTELEFAL